MVITVDGRLCIISEVMVWALWAHHVSGWHVHEISPYLGSYLCEQSYENIRIEQTAKQIAVMSIQLVAEKSLCVSSSLDMLDSRKA